MAKPPEVVDFDADATTVVVQAMENISGEGHGWINLQPHVAPEDTPPSGGPFRVFSVRGPAVPLCTWLPAEIGQRGTPYVSLGVQHGVGTRVAGQLADCGCGVPDGWRLLQDHPKKGLVVAAPAETPNSTLLDWLIRAGHALCPVDYVHWRAIIHRR